MLKVMLTTTDNPFDPFDDYDNWFAFDTRQGYHTPGYLARIVRSSDELSEILQNVAVENAIDEIIEMGLRPNYVKVTREVPIE